MMSHANQLSPAARKPVYHGSLLSPSRQMGSLQNAPNQMDKMSNASFLQGMKATFNQRKQSHDVRGRNDMAQTMGGGLNSHASSSYYKDNLMSPRNVISEARNQVANMHNTISEGIGSSRHGGNGNLSVVGGRKEGWGNPNTMARNGLNKRDHGLSVQDIVDNMLRKPAFGFENYEPKAVVKDLLPVNTHVRAKAKRRMFCDEAIKAKDKVPACDKYQTAVDWNKDPETRTAKFFTNSRMMIADEIMKKGKVPEKCSPGPAAHNHYEAWKGTKARVVGAGKLKEDRITFVTSTGWNAAQSPGFKYPSVNMRTFKETSPPRTIINKGEHRFGGAGANTSKKDEKAKNASPGPTSYDIEGSFSFANSHRGKDAIGKSKRVAFCESQARMNISPGPAKHNHSIKVLDKLSPSPNRASRRRL